MIPVSSRKCVRCVLVHPSFTSQTRYVFLFFRREFEAFSCNGHHLLRKKQYRLKIRGCVDGSQILFQLIYVVYPII